MFFEKHMRHEETLDLQATHMPILFQTISKEGFRNRRPDLSWIFKELSNHMSS
jgi:hypothetical protein